MNQQQAISSERRFPRVVIEQVAPQLDGGRHAIKRTVGDMLAVSAAIFCEGHGAITARLLYRGPGEDEPWSSVALRYEVNPDRWFGEITLDRLGRWEYSVVAWPDHYQSWSRDLRLRLAAGQDLESELLEGAALLEETQARHTGERAARLGRAAEILRDSSAPVADRAVLALRSDLLDDAFGPLREGDATLYERTLSVIVERELAACGAWYELFPRSQSGEPGRHGTFRDVEERLPALAALGFDVLYLPPIHPIGRTHRKGKNNQNEVQPDDVGSPWAIGAAEGGHDAVHPELGTLDDFDRLVRTAAEFGIEVALDYALQCSPDHPWVKEHPEWFFVRPDGTLRYAENPPKKYEDIYPLNFWCFGWQALWQECLRLFLFWIGHGVHIFRVDNPHTKPFAFWEWVLAEVRHRHPDAIFLSESFTRPHRMNHLAKLGFSQSYTYFTWKNTAWELREYLRQLSEPECLEYYRPNFFTNTPDILHEYLQHGGRSAFRVRLLLAATLSPSYGIYSGFELCENVPVRPGSEEYLDSEKYQIVTRDWNTPGNIKRDIARLNSIRRDNPALGRFDNLTLLHTEFDGVLAYWKTAPDNDLIVVVNLDPHATHETMVHLPLERLGLGPDQPFQVRDLLTGERYTWKGEANYVRLDPRMRVGHVLSIVRPGS
ncbi:MAG: alpha-1,4-glucan--maltose-1-phosphate maltosyltransferase [Polyangiaceae bacterium]|nr:alpha-1,4-glucan--maltose-1-phosphate maltosyltransferase [Polyangiaceae bacterium]